MRAPSSRARTRRAGSLVIAACLAALYLALAAAGLAVHSWWDGILGVVLGLFVCSIPVRHFLDMLIYSRVEGTRFRSRRALAGWVGVNSVAVGAHRRWTHA